MDNSNDKLGDKRVFIAVTICAAIFLLWQHFYLKPYTEKQQQLQQSKVSNQQNQAVTTNTQSSTDAPVKISQGTASTVQKISLRMAESGKGMAVSTQGGTVQDLDLTEYRNRKVENISHLIGGGKQLELGIPSQEWAYLSNVVYTLKEKGKDAQGNDRVILTYDDQNISLERSYTYKRDLFALDHQIKVSFKKQAPSFLFVGLQATREIPKDLNENERREVIFNKAKGQSTWNVADVDALKEDLGEGHWIGFSSRYFLKALVDAGSLNPQFQVRPLENNEVSANLIYKINQPNLSIPQVLYFGPKEVDSLKAIGHRLDMAVDFGWFTFIAYPLLQMLKWFYKFVHNYGIAIILLTVLVKILTYPLTYKSMKSMKEMQRIQPQLQKLRERFKDDKEKLNREMLQLMRSNGYNPMSGCFPIFIQMPIFIALYNVLFGCIDLYGQPFFGWIHDLSAKDPYFVTPILLGILMFVQQKMTPTTATDPAQQKMMTFMPLIFSFMMLWLPAGLTLYMLVNSVTTIVQQLFINKKLGIGPAVVATKL